MYNNDYDGNNNNKKKTINYLEFVSFSSTFFFNNILLKINNYIYIILGTLERNSYIMLHLQLMDTFLIDLLKK